ncbi:hexitol phosphatase HxpB [Lacimicrobium sp. SS2-24]|uniref:hexitol phosphatase HxpB n=1 Tax=Lacimicrobium sp. SS2-24 TaxID=2005569 RepID=UPI000B4B3F39|nr:hexitol phosphatase HxpB [Lacimicrobium sp. SS2-24]
MKLQPKAVIFDMDGLLIDSEPLWRMAEQQVFASAGITLNEQMCLQTTGLSTEEVVRYWYEEFDVRRDDVPIVAQQLEDTMVKLIREEGEPLPGVYPLLQRCQELDLSLAIASGSADRLIEATMERLALSPYFDFYHSAEHEMAGKPDPAVYLTTIAKLGLKASQCIAFEDSVRGVQAAKKAGIYTIAVPESGMPKGPDFAIADQVLDSLDQAMMLSPFAMTPAPH